MKYLNKFLIFFFFIDYEKISGLSFIMDRFPFCNFIPKNCHSCQNLNISTFVKMKGRLFFIESKKMRSMQNILTSNQYFYIIRNINLLERVFKKFHIFFTLKRMFKLSI
jgi:hypothetical protein